MIDYYALLDFFFSAKRQFVLEEKGNENRGKKPTKEQAHKATLEEEKRNKKPEAKTNVPSRRIRKKK